MTDGQGGAMIAEASLGAPAASGLGAADLAELLAAFNDVTAKLQVSHEQLTAEVSRLRGQLREADGQLQRSRRLAALGEMAAGIAHEIRNPLGSISLYSQMLAEDLTDRPGDREVAVKIGRAVRGLDAIVTDVLAFAGEFRLRLAEADVAGLLARAVESAGEPPAGVEVETRDVPRGLAAECDEGKMRQALVNIVRNGFEAIEAARRGGWAGRAAVSVGAGRGELGCAGAVVFSVRDTGTGVRGEAIERMFNPFYTTREAGTGLGLSIVHRIVDAHGGRVSVSNNGPSVGDGATVEIIIPARAGTAGTGTGHGEAHG